MPASLSPSLQRATERWFVRRGLPHAIAGYSASGDIFTRAAPFLSVVFALEVFLSFDDRFDGWAQVGVFVLGLAILVTAVVVVNRLRGRASLQLPDDVGWPELGLFVLVPAVLPVLFSDEPGTRFGVIVAVNAALVGLTYVATSFGLVPMIRFGAVQMSHRVGRIGQLMARSLPLLLLFTTFVFLNAEMWQVASDFPPLFYGILVGVLLVSAFGFLALGAPGEVSNLEHFDSWDDVCRLAARTDAPLADAEPSNPSAVPNAPLLERSDRTNAALLVVISQVVQVVLVALVIGLFYVFFGLLAVRAATIEQWTTEEVNPMATFDLFGSEVIITWAHVAVAGFIAAFSALQFSVSLITDETYRNAFYEEVTGEIREVLAVRALYHDRLPSGNGNGDEPT